MCWDAAVTVEDIRDDVICRVLDGEEWEDYSIQATDSVELWRVYGSFLQCRVHVLGGGKAVQVGNLDGFSIRGNCTSGCQEQISVGF